MSFLPQCAALVTAPCEACETRSLLPENSFFLRLCQGDKPKAWVAGLGHLSQCNPSENAPGLKYFGYMAIKRSIYFYLLHKTIYICSNQPLPQWSSSFLSDDKLRPLMIAHALCAIRGRIVYIGDFPAIDDSIKLALRVSNQNGKGKTKRQLLDGRRSRVRKE